MLRNHLLDNKPQTKSKYLDEDIIDLGAQTFTFPSQFTYRLLQVGETYIARPDRLSLDLYGTPAYGDLLCKINGISNPFELNVNDILVIPDVSFLQEFDMVPQIETEGDDETKPVAKQRKDSRTSNESVVGDTRFRIDSARRVVVY